MLAHKGAYTYLGAFLRNITDNATFTYTARYENYTEPAHGTLDFCHAIDSIDQPGRPPGEHDCPPQKGFALVMMSYWVQPMYIVPVSPVSPDDPSLRKRVVAWVFVIAGCVCVWVLNPSQKGNFHFRFDTVTQQGERIYCVEADVKFDYRDDRRDGQTSDLVIE